MRQIVAASGVGLIILALAAPMSSTTAKTQATRSELCWAQADKKGLHGEARSTFHKTCVEGALAPASPTHHDAGSVSAKAVTSPSGVDRTERSNICAKEADAKTTDENKRKSIRLACMASAAPPAATGTPTHPPAPTPDKDQLGSLPR